MAKTTINAISGVLGLVVSVGDRGEIMHFRGDIYRGLAVESPTRARALAKKYGCADPAMERAPCARLAHRREEWGGKS